MKPVTVMKRLLRRKSRTRRRKQKAHLMKRVAVPFLMMKEREVIPRFLAPSYKNQAEEH